MSIQSVSSATPTTSPTVPSGGPALGKNDFLKLMIAQLENQDPMNPMDQNQFLAQTAQFTSLEDLQNIDTDLQSLKSTMSSSGLTASAALLGHQVKSSTQAFQWDGQTPAALDFAVDGSASDVQVDILDDQGTVVRQMSTGPIAGGTHEVTWTGVDDQGKGMQSGTYTYRGTASAMPGTTALAYAAAGTVSGVTQSGGAVLYQIGDTTVKSGDLVQIL